MHKVRRHTGLTHGFLADRTIGRAFVTLCRLSVVCLSVCDVLYCDETVRPSKKVSEGAIGNHGQKVHFLGRRHISTSGFAATATQTAVFALIMPVHNGVQPNDQCWMVAYRWTF